MEPYLLEDDLLEYQSLDPQILPQYGQLVLMSEGSHQPLTVHRWYGEGKIKGDALDQWDDELGYHYHSLIGVVTARWVVNDRRVRRINYQFLIMRWAHGLQAKVSSYSTHPRLGGMANIATLALGSLLRGLERLISYFFK